MLPYALAGRDVIGCAETGTGKTAAYVLPVLSRLIRENREAGPRKSHHSTRALILAPTRELATQIDDEIQGFAYHAPVASAAVYGGVPIEPQERALKAGVDIVVATPGRLLDHMRSNVGDYSALEIFVLDEADRMMDMGFWPDVRKIAEALPPSNRAPDDAVLGDDAGRSDAVCRRAGADRGVRAGRIAPRPAEDDHARSAHSALAREGDIPREVPAAAPRARDCVRQHEDWMRPPGAATGVDRACAPRRCTRIDRNRSGPRRSRPSAPRRVRVLVATDVAARGLDIEDVPLIVNYEVPRGLDSYVHRVGRTGRNESTGHALTLADPAERRELELVEKAFGLKLVE